MFVKDLKNKVINKIKKSLSEKSKILQRTDGFIYLDSNLKSGKNKINRLTEINTFEDGHYLPTRYDELKGYALLELYGRIENNEFFIYRRIDGRDFKVRIKKK
jgi:hypothetical protein